MTVTAELSPPQSATLGYHDLPDLVRKMIGDEKHESSSLSTMDVIWVLYDRILNVTPDRPDDLDRDYFLLSKGHGPLSYYAVLAAKGFFDPEILSTFGRFDSPLGHHPDRLLIPGVEISSGSLGHGMPMAVGLALGLRARGGDQRVVCLLGDGELDEGSNFEAIAFAGRVGLQALTVIVLDNDSSSLGWPGGIAARFEIEGWSTSVVNGRNHDQIVEALALRGEPRPHVVVAEVR